MMSEHEETAVRNPPVGADGEQPLYNETYRSIAEGSTKSKFNDNKRCYYQMREASDRLCREQELSVIEKPGGHTPRSIYFAEKNGEPTHYNLMREALDEALGMCPEHRDLQLALRDRGYVLNCDPNRKYATIRSIGGGKPVRLYRLGQEYDLPAIEARLAENRRSFWRGGFAIYHRPERAKNKRRYFLLKGSIRTLRGKGGLFSLYLHYCYVLGILPKNSTRRPLSPELREECRRLDRYDRQIRLLAREKLRTTEDVQRFIVGKEAELNELSDARQKCYNRLRRCDDPDEICAVKVQRDLLTRQMKTCRQELATARSIPDRAETMKQNLRVERRMAMSREKGLRHKAQQKEQLWAR